MTEEIRIIKRYANRKLYDTATSSYITLADIGELAKTGVDFKVVDHKTGEDLTSVTFAQILLDGEKKGVDKFSSQTLKSLLVQGEEAITYIKGAVANVQKEAEKKKDWLEKALMEKAKIPDDIRKNLNDFVSGTQTSLSTWQKQADDKIEIMVKRLANVAQIKDEVLNIAQKLKKFEERLESLEKAATSKKKRSSAEGKGKSKKEG